MMTVIFFVFVIKECANYKKNIALHTVKDILFSTDLLRGHNILRV